MNKIISSFYLIRVGGKPSYVGYTNRPIEIRFREHLREKDFGDEVVFLENLGSLEYSFTWDENIINTYAKEVSDRETELIEEYGTQDSVWQKGTSGKLGGQTWVNIKNFVRTNHDNPKFRGLSNEAILTLIEYQREMIAYLRYVIRRTKALEETRLESVLRNTKPQEEVRLKSIITHTRTPEDTRLKNVLSSTRPQDEIRLRSIIGNTKPLEESRLMNAVRNTRSSEEVRLMNAIVITKPSEEVRLKSVINHTKPIENIRLRGVIGNTKPPEEVRLKSVLYATKPPEFIRLKSVISHTKALEVNILKSSCK